MFKTTQLDAIGKIEQTKPAGEAWEPLERDTVPEEWMVDISVRESNPSPSVYACGLWPLDCCSNGNPNLNLS